MRVPGFGNSRISRNSTTVVTRRRLKRIQLLLGLFCVVFASFGMMIIPAANAATGINHGINFQGKLTNPNGTNLADGNYTFVFSLYSAALGGTAIWTESDTLNLTDGIFQINLGPSAAGANTNFANVDFNSDSIYLGIKVGTDAEMSPRVQFTATPYAFNSEKLGGITAAGFAQLSPASAQSGNLNVTGSVQAATSLQAPLVDTATAVALQIGTGTASSVTIGRTTTPFTVQGNSASTFTATSGANTTTVSFATPTAPRSIIFPDAGGTLCTTTASTCSATYQTAGNYLAKNAADTSSFAVTATNYLYGFTNSSSAVASGVLKLDNGNNTGSGLVVVGTGNPAAGQALILVNAATGVTGSLIDLQVNAASKFNVNNSGNLSTAGTITSGLINNQTISSAANFTGTVTAATSLLAPLLDTASAGILSLGTTNATAINLNQNTVVASDKSFSANGNVTVGTTASATLFKNNGATQNNVCAYTGVSGTITLSTAGKTVNDCTAFAITDTGATTISSIAAPTAGAGSIIYINNLPASTNPITVLGSLLPVGNTVMLIFDGTNWTTSSGAAAVKLQDAYNNSAGATPSILETSTNQAMTVQSAFSSGIAAGAEIFGIHAAQSGDTLGSSIISATSYGLAVNLGADPASSGLDLQFGGNANRVIGVRSATAANQVGGSLSVKAGNANGTSTGSNGGALSLLAGNAAGTGSNAGGAVVIQGGTASGNATALGGAVTITGGSAGATAGSMGGAVSLIGGAGTSTGTGAAGNSATFSGGSAGGTGNNAGGPVTVQGGASTGTGTGGTANLNGGAASPTGAGGLVLISAGNGGSAALSGIGAGGNITLQAGSAVGSNSNNGGSISLTAGTRTGSGIPGTVNIGSPVFTSVTQTFSQTSNNQSFPSAGAEATTLQNNLDSYGTIVMNVTGAFSGATVSMPSPSNTSSGRVVYVSAASGSVAFTLSATGMSSVNMSSGNTATLVWNGTGWSGTTTASSLQQVYNNTSTAPASIITTSASKNILLQAGVGYDNANVFQIGNSSSAPVIAIDTTNTANGLNLATNGGVETSGTSGWTAFAGTGGATISQNVTATNLASGIGSINVAITGTGTGGANNALSSTALASSQLYNVSFNIKASSGTPTIAVQYFRDAAATLDATCSVPTNGTVNSSGFFKYTCFFTTSAPGNTKTTGNFLRISKTDGSAIANIYIDNLAVLAQNITGTKNSADIRVGGPLSQGLTLLTLDTFAAVPFTGAINQDLYGSLYYDTTLGRIQCYEIAGWGSCGAAPDSNLILEPEYAGAVLNPGLGSDTHIGTMTANICSGSTRMSLQPTEGTICGATEEFNFYRWTTSQVSAQTYSIFIKYQLPPTFGGFMDDSTIKMVGRVSSTTDASIAYAVFQNDGTQCGGSPAGTTTVTTAANTWQTVSYNGNEATTCTFNPSDIITFRVDMSSKNNAYAYASHINFMMRGK